MLTENEILKARGRGVGYLPVEDLIALSVSGPMIRAGGLAYDIRKAEPYGIYDRFDFDIPTLPNSDIYDRYYIRLLEAMESVRILQQALRDIPEGETLGGKGGYTLRAPEGEVYSRIEAPKGELGFYLASDGKTAPWRYHVRSPSYINLNGARTHERRLQNRGRDCNPGRHRHRAGRSGPVMLVFSNCPRRSAMPLLKTENRLLKTCS